MYSLRWAAGGGSRGGGSALRHQSHLRIKCSPTAVLECRRGLETSARRRIALVQEDRLHDSLHETCKWGATHAYGSGPTDTGMRRLSLDDNDAKARTWFVDETRRLGCSQHVVDEMGNIFAIRKGRTSGPPTAMGSHLDTQPGPGGRYDGILGIHAGIEALRVLEENNIETEFPICVVNWTNEEGARFPRSVMSSSVWAGLLSVKDAWNLKEIPALATAGSDGKRLRSVKEELERTGWLGKTKCDHKEMPLGAHFELHIEQGPILEREDKKIGVVTGGQAYRWFTLSIRGREAHTGTTPFTDRSDALQASARIIVSSREIAKQHGGLCTTGVLSLGPGSTNTIPGIVTFSLDIRHPQNEQVVVIEEALRAEVQRIIAEEGNCEAQWTTDTDSKAVDFHPDCIQAVRESAEEAVGADKWIEMRSGAGHDSFATSTRCPTTMIFVPSRNGISHNEREFSSKRDCALGAQVLLGAVLRYDGMRAKAAASRGLHTSTGLRRHTRPYSTSQREGEKGKVDRGSPKPKDNRPFLKKYPPVIPLPEAVNFDEPAVFNPIETAEAHTRFRKQAKRATIALAVVLVAAAAAYLGMGVAHADDGRDDGALSAAERKLTIDEDVKIPHGEIERRIKDAQKELGTGTYAVLAIKRSTTIAKAVALCVWDYRTTLNKKYAGKEEEAEGLRQCHLRSAHRVLEALQENGGLYIKLGQHISSVILLPVEWTDTMKPLQDQNTPTPLHDLETMFQAETGFTFDEAFSEIDAKPIGVASLAQVHRAVDRKTGATLAIKLMHPEVERFSEVDMRTVNVLVKWVKKAFPQFEFTWLAEEMNENMPLEMDFRHEAQNAERAALDFQRYSKTTAYIPRVPWVYKRAMAMEFIDGRRPDDLQYLAKHNIDRNRVSQELSRIFAQMLYLHGFFHADPHGGNVLIRPAPKGSRSPFNFEVVLLDHGLYFDIDQDLRTNYARFWLSLLSQATPRVKQQRRHYAKLIANIDDDLYPILESAITGRSGLEGSDDKNPTGVKGSKRKSSILDMDSGSSMSQDEQDHIRKTVMQKEGLFLDILQVLRKVPRRMLMVLKLNDLTRSLDASLHTTHGLARPFIITARYCALAVWRDDRSKLGLRYRDQGLSFRLLSDYLSSFFSYLWFNKGLGFFETMSDINATRRKFFSFSAAFAKCFDVTNARRASAGIDSQAQRQAKHNLDRQRAREEVDVESRQLGKE